MEGVHVRPATLDDVEVLTEIVIEATLDQGRFPLDSDQFSVSGFRDAHTEWTRRQFDGAEPDSSLCAIEVDGEVVGRLRVVRTADRVELAGLQLLPRVQGRGIGTAQVRAIQAEAGGRGVAATLSVERDNPRARALYERLGFRRVGSDEREHRLAWP